MKEKLQKIREEAVRQIEEAKELNALNDVRVSVLGKKGELTAVFKRYERRKTGGSSDGWSVGK